MASIYLIRHGQASFGAENYDELSDLGIEQAKLIGPALAQKMSVPDLVVMGSMYRHKQTAQNALAGFPDNNPETLENACWNEYDHQAVLGAFDERFKTPSGLKAVLAKQENPQLVFLKIFNDAILRWMSGDFDQDYPESWIDFKTRLQNGLRELVERSKTKRNILVFTSGGPISYLAQSLLGVPEEKLMQMNWTLVNAGITKLVTSSNGLFVATLNEHTSFEKQDFKHLITYK